MKHFTSIMVNKENSALFNKVQKALEKHHQINLNKAQVLNMILTRTLTSLGKTK